MIRTLCIIDCQSSDMPDEYPVVLRSSSFFHGVVVLEGFQVFDLVFGGNGSSEREEEWKTAKGIYCV